MLVPVSTGIRGVFQSFAAYWLTMLLAGVFTYGAIFTAQGFAALLLPRRLFLRFSGYLQLAAVFGILAGYFVQPGFYSLDELVSGSHRLILWLPSYWFLALYQQLNGSMHPALQPLATCAWIGLAAVVCVTPIVYALSYWRMLSAIAPAAAATLVTSYQTAIANHDAIRDAVLDQTGVALLGSDEG